jgi:hypothetical protein
MIRRHFIDIPVVFPWYARGCCKFIKIEEEFMGAATGLDQTRRNGWVRPELLFDRYHPQCCHRLPHLVKYAAKSWDLAVVILLWNAI